jgi:hypothetical protein
VDTEITAGEREVGNCHPPLHSRFKAGNQASKGVRNGKGKSGVIAELQKLMRNVIPGDKQGRKGREIFAASLFLNATKGNGTAIKQMLDRLEGPIPTVLTGDKDNPIVVDDARTALLGRIAGIAERIGEGEGDQGPDAAGSSHSAL